MQLKTTNDLEEEESWQDKDYDELDTLLVPQLKEICKTYNHPVTGKRKHELIEMIMGGRSEDNLLPTEMEKVIKKALLSPLRDKDRSAWKLGLLNEAKVVSVIKAVVKGVGYELVHCWSVGLLRNKDNSFAATSLDGWLIVKEDESEDKDYCPKEDLFGDESDVDLEYDSDVDETMSDGSSANDSDEYLSVSKFV